jgi:hypothetical protein
MCLNLVPFTDLQAGLQDHTFYYHPAPSMEGYC